MAAHITNRRRLLSRRRFKGGTFVTWVAPNTDSTTHPTPMTASATSATAQRLTAAVDDLINIAVHLGEHPTHRDRHRRLDLDCYRTAIALMFVLHRWTRNCGGDAW